jgi:hypothetical protein
VRKAFSAFPAEFLAGGVVVAAPRADHGDNRKTPAREWSRLGELCRRTPRKGSRMRESRTPLGEMQKDRRIIPGGPSDLKTGAENSFTRLQIAHAMLPRRPAQESLPSHLPSA